MKTSSTFQKKLSSLLNSENEASGTTNLFLSNPFKKKTKLDALPHWNKWIGLMSELDWLWMRLRDDHSRTILLHTVLYHLKGNQGLLRWRGENLRWLPPVPEKPNEEYIRISFMDWILQRRSLHSIGLPITLFLPNRRPSAVIDLEQYADPRHRLFVRESDIVIDGGGCWGDSALYFAYLAGINGEVYSFEFLPENLKVMRRNLEMNPELMGRVRIIEKPLWSEVGKEMEFICDGPATRIGKKVEDSAEILKVESTTIDALYDSGVFKKVDFIKLDIEGAELEALHGAKNVISKFRPLMALCVYHCPEHFTQLARFVDQIHPDYYFSLDHMHDGPWETVLYASPR